MTRIRCLPLALTLALGVSAAHADDLMQVYQEARASDPTLAGAEATKLATDENVDQARALLLPQIAAALSFTRTTGGTNEASFVPIGPGGSSSDESTANRQGHRARSPAAETSRTRERARHTAGDTT